MKRRLIPLLALAFFVAAAPPPPRAIATFAGGCFWCMEPPFQRLAGVVSVTSGYTGGRVDKPTYDEVSYGQTGHREAVQIVYDPARISYQHLLAVYWHNVDPLDRSGQFCDKGEQYRTAIYFHDAAQRTSAEASLREVAAKLHHAVYTDLVPAVRFYPAEEYHQHYADKNPLRYKFYRFNCGRDQRLKKLWGEAAGH